jgi:DNA-directed RNA polymerase sigma subunit (sigma70/sigma32)
LEQAQRAAWKLYPQPEPRQHVPQANPCTMTRAEVGQVLNVSSERIRQIEVAALSKCRRWCARRGLELDDLIR